MNYKKKKKKYSQKVHTKQVVLAGFLH